MSNAARVLIVSANQRMIGEIEGYLKRMCREDKIITANTEEEARTLFMEHFETLQLIFSDELPETNVHIFIKQITESAQRGLLIACSDNPTANQFLQMSGCREIFDHEHPQSLYLNVHHYLQKDPSPFVQA